MRKQLLVGVLVLLAMLSGQAARADVVLRNGTGYDIPYQYRFGNGGWVQIVLPAHARQSWFGAGPSEIRFQSDIGNGGGLKVYTLLNGFSTFRVTDIGTLELYNP